MNIGVLFTSLGREIVRADKAMPVTHTLASLPSVTQAADGHWLFCILNSRLSEVWLLYTVMNSVTLPL